MIEALHLPLPLLAADALHAPDVGGLLGATLPELILTAGMLAVLLIESFRGATKTLCPRISLVTVLLALGVVTFGLFRGARRVEVGPLMIDDMARLFRILFLTAGAGTLLFAMRKAEAWFSQGEFHALLLASLAGMSVLSASTDMLTAYLAFETVSFTGYLMVGYVKGDRGASEAGLKYVIFGAASSGAMLFGLTLLFGLSGSTSMGETARALYEQGPTPAAVAGAVLVFAGVAFKVSAAPFHFWAPDAYAGATTPVAGFLAVASKAAGFAVVFRFLGTAMRAFADMRPPHLWDGAADPLPEGSGFGFLPPGPLPYWILGAGAAVTMIVGNTAALRQKELKRLLAWSSVAHAGYMLMALSAGGAAAFGGIHFYFWVYMLMTLGGFGIVGLLASHLGGTEMRHYNGLSRRNPLLAAALLVLMVSLTGLPPTLGFWGKVLLFMPVVGAKLYGLAILGLLTSAVSLYYYAGLVRAMYLVPPAEGSEGPVVLEPPDWMLVGISTAPLLLAGIYGWHPAAAAFLNSAKDWVGVTLR